MKILVVADHVRVTETLTQLLDRIEKSVHVLEANTTAEAVAIARAESDLDLIVLDTALPDVSGYSVLAEFRMNHRNVPVVVLSSSVALAGIMKAMQAGAAGFIPTSSSAGVMVSAMRLVLSGGVYVPPELLQIQGALQNDTAASHSGAGTLTGSRRPIDPADLGLSERQSQVLALVVQGKTNKEIGRGLNLAEATVKAHISAALRALNVSSRTQAVIAVAQLGIDLQRFANTDSTRRGVR